MKGINKAIILGNLGADPQLMYAEKNGGEYLVN